jgi:hypothetical protein
LLGKWIGYKVTNFDECLTAVCEVYMEAKINKQRLLHDKNIVLLRYLPVEDIIHLNNSTCEEIIDDSEHSRLRAADQV